MLNISCFGNKQLPPLIFLHGLFGSTQDFIPMIDLLKEHFYCIGIDLPGHGLSPPLNPLSFSSILNYLLDTITSLNLHKPSLVGYSLGGRLSMLLHQKAPSFFHKIMILSAHPGLTPDELPRRILLENHWIKLLEELSLCEFLKKWYKQPLFQTLTSSPLILQRSQGNKKAFLNIMDALRLSNQLPLWDHIDTAQDTWLFVSGEKDKVYTDLYKKLPDLCQKATIINVSHALHLEDPKSCALLLKY
ncbi:MAG: alpha/beta fold hydrolase [Chlamydiota bacterium]